jgi:hypothetical protein
MNETQFTTKLDGVLSVTPLNANVLFCRFFLNLTMCMTKLSVWPNSGWFWCCVCLYFTDNSIILRFWPTREPAPNAGSLAQGSEPALREVWQEQVPELCSKLFPMPQKICRVHLVNEVSHTPSFLLSPPNNSFLRNFFFLKQVYL